MRSTLRPVLFSVALSPFLLQPLYQPGSPEPGADLAAGALLVEVIGAESAAPRARVRLDLRSTTTDATAEIVLAGEAQGESGRLLARAFLPQGRLRSVPLEVELEPGRENHLLFQVKALGDDGDTRLSTVYLRVNLDPELEPEVVGSYLQYQGETLPQEQP